MSLQNPRPRINPKNARGLLLMVEQLRLCPPQPHATEEDREAYAAGFKYAKELAKWKENGA